MSDQADWVNDSKPAPYKCWLGDWFLATRACSGSSEHCADRGWLRQCDYCMAKQLFEDNKENVMPIIRFHYARREE